MSAAARLARIEQRTTATGRGEWRPADLFASRVTGALGATWAAIRQRHLELPAAVVTLASGSDGKASKWGHWGASRWDVNGDEAGEVLIAGELLAPGGGNDPSRPVEERVLGTLLHEAAHALATARGIQDTSRGSRYHNARFRLLAEEVGLECAGEAGVYGWALTRLRSTTPAHYAEELAGLRDVLVGHRASEGQGATDGAEAGAASPRVRLVCSCERRLYVARGVAELGPILCGVCEGEFLA